MEALSFLKFWRPNISISTADDDDLFELELDLPDLDTNCTEAKNESQSKMTSERRQSTFHTSQSLSLKTKSLFSKRKITPIEAHPTARLQLNVSLFKSSPKFQVFMFRKSKSMPKPTNAGEPEEPVYLKRAKNSLSLEGAANGGTDGSRSDAFVSKRFSKGGIPRYRCFVKPFSVKGGHEKSLEDLKLFSSGNLLRVLPSSPTTARKFVGKGMIAVVNGGVSLSPSSNGDSWAEQNDGIQGAILHCKK